MKGTGLFSATENIDYSNSTVKTFCGRKVFLLILSILAAVSDLVAMIIFAVAGLGGYITIPILLIAVDALFIAGVCFSNFRFKYSVGIWTAYIAVAAIILSFVSLSTSREYPVMTNTAIALNTLSHIVLFGAIIFAGIFPILKQNKKIKIAMAAVCAVAVILVCAFTLFFSVNGYYGQGFVSQYRNVTYHYDSESDTYIAYSAELGRSKKVLIPEQFNGKKVSGINCFMFTDKTIDDVCIQSKQKINLIDDINLANINPNIRIGVDRDLIDGYRKDILGSYMGAANRMYPCNLNENETYITFAYHNSVYDENIDIVPTWIGEIGEKFSMEYADIDYFKHTNQESFADLIWCWENNYGKVLKEFKDADGNTLAGRAIDGNILQVDVDFNSVFQLKVLEDNDMKYEPSDGFKTTTVNGKQYEHLYATVNTIEDITSQLKREGFNLKWKYKSDYYPYNIGSVTNLPDAFQEDEQNALRYHEKISASISPQWELKAPSNAVITADKNSYIYGDDIKLIGTAQAPNADCTLEYTWDNLSGNYSVDNDECSMTNVLPSQSGSYSLTIAAKSDKTSLTSKTVVYKDIVIVKKNLDIIWTQPDDMVYDGSEKQVAFSCGEGQLINGDTLDTNVIFSGLSATNANSYIARIYLTGEINGKYAIATGSTFQYTISPRPTEVNWSIGSYTYNGYAQGPSASARNVSGGILLLNLSGASNRNAGKYTVTASVSDKNYTLTNPTEEYVIKQKPITVRWEDANLIYSGQAQYPRVSAASGTVNYESVLSQLIYLGYGENINAKDGYTVSVTLPQSSNYKFDTLQSKVYNISKRSITANWNTSGKLTYNGGSQGVNIVGFNNIVTKDEAGVLNGIKYSGAQTDAGEDYQMSAELSEEASVNYIAANMTCEYSIDKRAISAVWSEATSFTYDGNSHIPVIADIANIIEKDKASVMSGLKYEGAQTNAGSDYTATVSLDSNSLVNYTLTNSYCRFTIAKAQTAAVWSDVSIDGGNVTAPALLTDSTAYAGQVRIIGYTYRNSQGQVIESIPSQNGTYSVTAEIVSRNFEVTGLQKTFTVSGFEEREVA